MSDEKDWPAWVQALSIVLTGGGVYFAAWWKNRGAVQTVADNSIRATLERQDEKIAQQADKIEELERLQRVAVAQIAALDRVQSGLLNSLGAIEAHAKSVKIYLETYASTAERDPEAAALALLEAQQALDSISTTIGTLRIEAVKGLLKVQ